MYELLGHAASDSGFGSDGCRRSAGGRLIHPKRSEHRKRQIELPSCRTDGRVFKHDGISPCPGGLWMEQAARNLTDEVPGFLNGSTHFIHDRDPMFTKVFCETLNYSDSCVMGERVSHTTE